MGGGVRRRNGGDGLLTASGDASSVPWFLRTQLGWDAAASSWALSTRNGRGGATPPYLGSGLPESSISGGLTFGARLHETRYKGDVHGGKAVWEGVAGRVSWWLWVGELKRGGGRGGVTHLVQGALACTAGDDGAAFARGEGFPVLTGPHIRARGFAGSDVARVCERGSLLAGFEMVGGLLTVTWPRWRAGVGQVVIIVVVELGRRGR
jgi:hypothetical protein